MNSHDLLTELLRDEADSYAPGDGSEGIRRRVRARRRARAVRRMTVPAVAVVVAAIAVPLALRGHERRQPVTSAGPTTGGVTASAPSTAPPTTIAAGPAHLSDASFLSVDQLPAGPYWGGRWAQATPIVDPRLPASDPRAGQPNFLCQRQLVVDPGAAEVRARSYFSAVGNPDGRQFDEHLELSPSDEAAARAIATVQSWLADCRGLDGTPRQSNFVRARSFPALYDGAALYEHIPSTTSGDPIPRVVGVGRVGRIIVVFEVSTQGPPAVGSINPVEMTLRAALARVAPASSSSTTGVAAGAATSAHPSALPGVLANCNESPPHVPQVKPSGIDLACADNGNGVENIVWTSWTASSARGSGRVWQKRCVPDCASGGIDTFPASISLSGVRITPDGPIFLNLLAVYQGAGPNGHTSDQFSLPTPPQ
jgi:hypothetical protein